jgi:hypothetical protein
LWLVSGIGSSRISLPRPIPRGRLDPLREKVATCLERIDVAYRRIGAQPVPYPLLPAAQAQFDEWYSARAGSLFERRLDTYGHRLLPLLAATSGREAIDEDLMRRVLLLLQYQLDVRRENDPVDADSAIAAMEEKIRRTLSRGALPKRDVQRKVHYNRAGIWVWETALRNLIHQHEIGVDGDRLYLITHLAVSKPDPKSLHED